MYVTLEPCCHHGKQPPCVEAILASGIRRVVIGSADPNPLVAGKGVAILRAHGVEFKTMVDIQGLEDFYGDMDFKVGGTKKGITAIQVDIKVDGLTPAIIAEAFEKTRKARTVHSGMRSC